MNQIVVNGKEISMDVSHDWHFKDFLSLMRKTHVSDQSVISSVRVNGIEITGDEELELGALPVREIEKIEITTVHPTELTEETLKMLVSFSDEMIGICRMYADTQDAAEASAQFIKLIDSLEIFADGIVTTRKALSIVNHEVTDALEMDLAAILKDVFDQKKSGNILESQKTVKEELIKNIESWRDRGIPALIRARDH